MEHLEPSELELKMSAFQKAMCSVLAEVASDVVVLRSILIQRGIIPEKDYNRRLELFGKQRLASYQQELAERIHLTAERILENLKGGKPN